jgi:hypothetical protein
VPVKSGLATGQRIAEIFPEVGGLPGEFYEVGTKFFN